MAVYYPPIKCEDGFVQDGNRCISIGEHDEYIKRTGFVVGCAFSLGAVCLIVAVFCFVVYKKGKSKKRSLFIISILALVLGCWLLTVAGSF